MSVREPFTSWGAAIAVAVLGVYLALGQNLMHGIDAYYYLRFVDEGRLHNDLHVLYQPAAWVWTRVLAVAGVPLYEAMRSLSSVAAAAGVFGCHRAAVRMGCDGQRAAMVALGCAMLPAVLHAATIVEIDGVQFGCFGLVWIPFANLLRDGGGRAAALTGLGTAVTAGFHGAGHLFAATLCGLQLAWGWPGRPLRKTAPRALLLGLVHATGTLLLGWIAGARGQATMVANTVGIEFDPTLLPQVLRNELLLPYLPFVLLLPIALARPGLRSAAAGTLLCLVGYAGMATWIMGLYRDIGHHLPQGDIVERGAFLLGTAPPMVLLSVRALPRPAGWLAVLAAAVLGVAQQRAHDWPADPEGYARGFAELNAGHPAKVVVADAREWAWIARRHPRAPCIAVGEIVVRAQRIAEEVDRDLSAAHYLAWFGVESDRQHAAGRRLLITERAMTALRTAAPPELAAAAARLGEVYELERVAAGPFAAVSLRRR